MRALGRRGAFSLSSCCGGRFLLNHMLRRANVCLSGPAGAYDKFFAAGRHGFGDCGDLPCLGDEKRGFSSDHPDRSGHRPGGWSHRRGLYPDYRRLCGVPNCPPGGVPFFHPVLHGGNLLIGYLWPRLSTGPITSGLWELLSGSAVFVAVFLVGDRRYASKHFWVRIVLGLLTAAVCMAMRYYGVYEQGAFFAVLLVNAVVPLFDRRLTHLFEKGGALHAEE